MIARRIGAPTNKMNRMIRGAAISHELEIKRHIACTDFIAPPSQSRETVSYRMA
jgi:hypothetical protein